MAHTFGSEVGLEHGDEPPHQICLYTLLFLLFHYFLYIINPPLCTPALTWPHTIALALTSLDWSRLFDGHMIYDSHIFISIPSISNVCPPVVQPIMSPHTTQSGIFYSFASNEPYTLSCCYSYLTCLYLPSAQQKSQRITHMSFPQNWDLALTPHTISHLFCTISHCIALPQSHHLYLPQHTWRQSLAPRLHPLRAL